MSSAAGWWAPSDLRYFAAAYYAHAQDWKTVCSHRGGKMSYMLILSRDATGNGQTVEEMEAAQPEFGMPTFPDDPSFAELDCINWTCRCRFSATPLLLTLVANGYAYSIISSRHRW